MISHRNGWNSAILDNRRWSRYRENSPDSKISAIPRNCRDIEIWRGAAGCAGVLCDGGEHRVVSGGRLYSGGCRVRRVDMLGWRLKGFGGNGDCRPIRESERLPAYEA